MKRSTDRILTTHTGSLPRPMELAELLLSKDAGQPVDPDELAAAGAGRCCGDRSDAGGGRRRRGQ